MRSGRAGRAAGRSETAPRGPSDSRPFGIPGSAVRPCGSAARSGVSRRGRSRAVGRRSPLLCSARPRCPARPLPVRCSPAERRARRAPFCLMALLLSQRRSFRQRCVSPFVAFSPGGFAVVGAALCSRGLRSVLNDARVLSGQSSTGLVSAGPVVSSGPFGGCPTSSAGGGGEGAAGRQTEIHERRAQVGLGRRSGTAGRFGPRLPLETPLLCFLGYSEELYGVMGRSVTPERGSVLRFS